MEERALATTQPKTMMIKNLCPGLQEVGKVKIGNKGAKRTSGSGSEWQPPQKLDHFLITTLERGNDGNYVLDQRLHQKFGTAPKSIPVRLIYDDIALNFATRYICYYGKTVFCSGDGEYAQRLQKGGTHITRACPCGRQDPKYAGDDGQNGPDEIGGSNTKGKCKINGILSFIIDGADSVGGVWKFRTTSYNTVVGIMSSLALISRITGGRLAGIPLNMTVSPKTTQDPIKGGQVTVYVVGLTFAGNMETLRNTGYQIAMDEAKHGISMKDIESRAIQLLSYVPSGGGLGEESDIEVVEEFYPEEAQTIHSGQHQTTFADVSDQRQGDGKDQPLFSGVSDDSGTGQQQGAAAAPARERGKPSPGKQRRNAAEVEEDRLADERDAQMVEAAKQQSAPLNECPCEHPVSRFDGDKEICEACGDVLSEEGAEQQIQEQAAPAQQTTAAPAAQQSQQAQQQSQQAEPDLF